MDSLLDQSPRVIANLNARSVDYIVVGGVAMTIHGLLRATEALDVFVRADAENIERLKAALQMAWDDPSIDEILAADLCAASPAVRYGPPSGDMSPRRFTLA